jgi:hypothetical protein
VRFVEIRVNSRTAYGLTDSHGKGAAFYEGAAFIRGVHEVRGKKRFADYADYTENREVVRKEY